MYKLTVNCIILKISKAFPEIEKSGGVVMGKGKGIFSGGYQIPLGTKVTIVRKE